MKNMVAAMEFGTSKLVALVAETSGRQRCDIIGAGTVVYDGYMDGRWNAPAALNEAMAEAVRAAEDQAHIHIREIFVGVPGSFSQVRTVEVKVELQGADPRVTERDIAALLDKATDELGPVRGSVIHRSPAWFIVDDGKKTLEPMGVRGYELRAMISFVIADQFFLEDVQERFRALDITVAGCLSTPIGEAMLFVPEEERDRAAVLVDVGYLTTEVMVVQGDAITSLTNIPMGGGHIAADLAYGLEVTLPVAEQIKRAYVYGLSAGQSTFEGTDQAGNAKTFTREQVEEVLEPRAEEICEAIRDAIRDSGAKLGKWSPVYLTGGGLAINRGGREYLAAKLERTVRELPRKAVKLSSPAYSSALGLLDLLIDTTTSARASGGMGGFFRSLFGG
jgi:cell division protein FtsA